MTFYNGEEKQDALKKRLLKQWIKQNRIKKTCWFY